MSLVIERTSALKIPKCKQTNIYLDSIKKYLTRSFQDYTSGETFKYKYFKENESFLFVPRYFPIEHYIPGVLVKDNTCAGEKIDIEAAVTPRNELQRNAMRELVARRSGILEIDPGEGKTVLSIYTVSKLKVKTLVFMHKVDLVKQWIERFQEFSNYSFEDIGFLQSHSFEECLQKPVILATVQGILAIAKKHGLRFSQALRNANIGLMISDECHTTTGAHHFSNASYLIPARRTIGLSATPDRYDRTEDIIEYHLGEIFTVSGRGTTIEPEVVVIMFDHQILVEKDDEGNVVKDRYKYLHWSGRFNKARYLNILKNSQIYMSLLKYLIEKSYEEGRHILCLTERIKQIDAMAKMINVPEEDIGKFCGSAGLEQLKKRVVLATPQKARDGMDQASLDTLILCSPLSNITQSSGRIVRYHENKKRPIIYDLVDTAISDFMGAFSHRMRFYNKKEWKVTKMTWNGKYLEGIHEENSYR